MNSNNTSVSKATLDDVNSILSEYCGITFNEINMSILINQVSKRITALKLNEHEYVSLLRNSKEEQNKFTNLITNNLTFFFRGDVHFNLLREHLLPMWVAKDKPVFRIWSAGCSTGQEPYSIAMTVLNYFQQHGIKKRVEITASDITLRALIVANKGVYDKEKFKNIPIHLYKNFVEEKGNNYIIKDAVKDVVEFHIENLIKPTNKKTFDIIFCRNVIIYFNTEAQKKVIQNFYDMLDSDSFLLLGQSESIRVLDKNIFITKKIGEYNTIYKA